MDRSEPDNLAPAVSTNQDAYSGSSSVLGGPSVQQLPDQCPQVFVARAADGPGGAASGRR